MMFAKFVRALAIGIAIGIAIGLAIGAPTLAQAQQLIGSTWRLVRGGPLHRAGSG
jgi:hypothetical protein